MFGRLGERPDSFIVLRVWQDVSARRASDVRLLHRLAISLVNIIYIVRLGTRFRRSII